LINNVEYFSAREIANDFLILFTGVLFSIKLKNKGFKVKLNKKLLVEKLNPF